MGLSVIPNTRIVSKSSLESLKHCDGSFTHEASLLRQMH
jgi:hypothetical protein